MPYISSEKVKEKRNALKKAFPDVKFSVTLTHCSIIKVVILEAKFDRASEESVNQFYIKEHYEKEPEVRDFLLKVKKIVNEGNYIESEDGDYGSIPSFYISISFGKWDKPYKQIIK